MSDRFVIRPRRGAVTVTMDYTYDDPQFPRKNLAQPFDDNPSESQPIANKLSIDSGRDKPNEEITIV
jgi:hypothetical protein